MDNYLKIHIRDPDDFLKCTVATTVLHPDVRSLNEIAERVVNKGYEWCIENRSRDKDAEWWRRVQRIHEGFAWERLPEGDPITAKPHAGSLEFGSIDGFGGGCHRSIALAAAVLSGTTEYRLFDILLHCR